MSIEDNSVTKESLAAKPIKCVLKDEQRYLSIGYDLGLKRLTIKYFGVDPEKLPVKKKKL